MDIKSIDLDNIVPSKLKVLLEDEVSRQKVIVGGALVFAVLYTLFAIVPAFSGFVRTRKEIGVTRDKIDLVNTRLNNIDKMKDNLTVLKKELKSYAKGLPDEKGVSKFLEDLSVIAKYSRVKILSITPYALKTVQTGEKGNVYYREMPIVITANSGYHQLGQFISNLESGERFVTIEEVRIQNNIKYPRMHTIRIVLKTYVSVEEPKK